MYDTLIKILEESVRRNGEKPLTNAWLLNILRMADRAEYNHELQEMQSIHPGDWGTE